MYPTKYRRPKSLAEAQSLFGECENASFLSGGHTLLPALKLRLANPSDLIDLATVRPSRHSDLARVEAHMAALDPFGR